MNRKYDMTHRLTRAHDGYVAGICEGLGRQFEISPNTLRIIWLIATLGFGIGFLLYGVLWWVLPKEREVPVESGTAPTVGQPPLVRTVVDRKIFGVCGGIARRWDLDPSMVRLLALTALSVSCGLALVAYLGASMFLPTGERHHDHAHPVEL